MIRSSTDSRPKTAPSEPSGNILANPARWPSAEKEKQTLFEKAKADAERVQSGMVSDALALAPAPAPVSNHHCYQNND